MASFLRERSDIQLEQDGTLTREFLEGMTLSMSLNRSDVGTPGSPSTLDPHYKHGAMRVWTCPGPQFPHLYHRSKWYPTSRNHGTIAQITQEA